MRIVIEQPELLHKLCDYLSRHGFIAVAATSERAQVLIPEAGSSHAAHLLLEARLRAWTEIHPAAGVRIEP